MMVTLFTPQYAAAASGDIPDHDKILKVNEDGTYTIAMNVTGDAEKVTEPVNTNVIVILDTSGSMDENTGNTETTYTPSNQNANNMYGTNDGGQTYFPIYRRGNWPNYYYTTTQYGNTRYNGQRYTRQVSNQSRLEAAQDAINDLAEALLSKNGQDGNPSDLIEMALVTFASDASISRTPTTSLTQFETAVNNTNANGGTNWEGGLRTANNVNFNDQDQTFVIFVSDGNPTFYINDQTGQRGGNGQEQTANINTSYNQAVPAAQALANKVTPGNFFTIGAYGNVDRMESLTTAAGAPAANYFSAENTAALQEALATILEKIEMEGIAEVAMEDGTTSSVTTTSGEVSHLLTVDTDSYKYYRAGGTDEEGNEKYDAEANEGLGEEWSDAPEATFEGGAVKWDLQSQGVLENGVTYTVTFDCWPSQETLDIVADLKNDPSSYDTLDANIKKYIDEDGNLKTNTSASISYTDTRTGESNEEEYENPDPVTTAAVEQLAISKEWQNDVDSQTSAPIDLEVTRDGTHKYDVILSADNNWKGNIYISVGIMRTGASGQMEVLEEGHDFTFVEPEDIGYRWELDVPVVRPMMIDGELTMLVKVDEAHPAPAGADTYTIKGTEYYADNSAAAALTATNYRRSQLVLTKEVTGENVPEDATFPFTLTVNNSKEDEGTAGNLNSDYYVWFTTIDDNGDNTDDVTVTGADKEAGTTGWYHVASGTAFTVDLPADYSVRFINLPKDSTYTFAEGTLDTGFIFEGAELTAGEDDTFQGAQTSTGTVADWNSEYAVTYTNEYVLTDVTATKIWDDANDQDGVRPASLTLTLNGLPAGTTAPTPEITKSTDGNTWTYTWTGLPKYDASGEEITYTVSEDSVPADYEKSPADPVASGGTITNTHTPSTIDVSVIKIWEDKDNQDGVRPASVSVQLYQTVNGTETAVGDPQTLNAGNKWTYVWEDLPEKTGGTAITYSVKEDESALPEGYTAKVTGNVTDGFTVTNSYTPETTSVSVEKKWEDSDDQDGIRPRSVTVNLLADGTAVEGKELTLDASNSWKGTFSDLPKNANGTAIKYTVEEVKDNTITGEDGDKTYAISVTGDAAKGFTVTNTHTPATTTYTVTKVWDDANDKDGKRPDSILVKLYADGKVVDGKDVKLTADNEWTYTWENLPKMNAGTEIKYSADESEVPDGYTKEDPEVTETSTTITNTHEADTTTFTVTKVWDDEDDRDGLRPESIMVQLYADGEASGEPVELSEANNWTYTWENLVKNQDVEASEEPADPDAAATPAAEDPVLTVEEVEAAPAEEADAAAPADEAAVTEDAAEEPAEAVMEEPAAEDAAEEPAEAAVEELAEAAPAEETVAAPAAEPTPIAYEAKEVSEVEGYTTTYKETANGMIITNKHVPVKTQVAVKKIWDDDSDKAGARPDDATVQLYKTVGGEKTAVGKEVPIGTTKDTWTAVWTDLPVVEDGEEITYSVEESLPDGCRYVSEVGDGVVAKAEDSGTIEITNTLNAVMSDPPVRKIVEGNPPQDDTFTFQMKAVTDGAPMPEGSADGVKTVEITGSGSYEFGEMWFDEEGEYVYEISEINGGLKNYTYDTTVYTLTVEVTRDESGKLVKEESVTAGGGSAGEIVFTNVYEEEVVPPAPKTGDDMLYIPAVLLMMASGLVLALMMRRRGAQR